MGAHATILGREESRTLRARILCIFGVSSLHYQMLAAVVIALIALVAAVPHDKSVGALSTVITEPIVDPINTTASCDSDDFYENIVTVHHSIGGWGGTCTCPDGQTYLVGDNFDACASLACEGGIPGDCQSGQFHNGSFTHVRCGQCRQPVCHNGDTIANERLTGSENSNAGGWGGLCRCPDGAEYWVGDNHDGCNTLACDGGTKVGGCRRESHVGSHVRVKCGSCPVYPPPPPELPPPPASPKYPTGEMTWQKINCPMMGTLVKNHDLVPDAWGMVSKAQTVKAMLNVGLSLWVTEITTADNFDHLNGTDDQKKLNIFAMNAIDADPNKIDHGALAVEHFRSTGIRDNKNGPQTREYHQYELCAAYDYNNKVCNQDSNSYSKCDIEECCSIAWDRDPGTAVHIGPDSEVPNTLPSNDVDDKQRPVVNGTVCGPHDDGNRCPSALHAANANTFREIAMPRGDFGYVDKASMRQIWMESEYPQGFLDRSPRDCINTTDPTEAGCDLCKSAANASEKFFESSENWKYCACLIAKRLNASTLTSNADYIAMSCGAMLSPLIQVAEHIQGFDPSKQTDIFAFFYGNDHLDTQVDTPINNKAMADPCWQACGPWVLTTQPNGTKPPLAFCSHYMQFYPNATADFLHAKCGNTCDACYNTTAISLPAVPAV